LIAGFDPTQANTQGGLGEKDPINDDDDDDDDDDKTDAAFRKAFGPSAEWSSGDWLPKVRLPLLF